jgi:hypothetical protein
MPPRTPAKSSCSRQARLPLMLAILSCHYILGQLQFISWDLSLAYIHCDTVCAARQPLFPALVLALSVDCIGVTDCFFLLSSCYTSLGPREWPK